MIDSLRNHPFAVKAFFTQSLVLTYAVPVSLVNELVPSPLEPDLLHGEWGFVAAAFVETRNLRASGFPVWTGNDFLLAGYRVYVRYTNKAGRRLRGLYILGSQTDSRKMQVFGNLFTHYRYSRSSLCFVRDAGTLSINSVTDGLSVVVDLSLPSPALPAGSPFNDWKEARRFSGPMPFTFSISGSDVVVVEGVRSNWLPKPVALLQAHIPFFMEPSFPPTKPANAFIVEGVPYHWKKGVVEKW
ncbi:MAG: hypothetical protein EOO05_09910 [Chitinophagaceae bacterium]|nr:MAG: hypothetical protein EOO05_09910 [Chitinophagaceae bacterium]